MLTYASVIYVLLICNNLQAACKPTTSCSDKNNNNLEQHPNVRNVLLDASLATIIENLTTNLNLITQTAHNLYIKVSNIFKEFNVFTEYTPTNNGNNTSLLQPQPHTFPDISMKKLQQPFQMIERLTDFINEKLQAVLIHFNNTLIANSETIDNFSHQLKSELRQVPETELIKDSCHRVDALLEQSFAQLKDCCSVSIRPLGSLCRSARQLISKRMNAFVDVLDHVQTCLEDKNSYDDYLIPCLMMVVHDEAAELIRRAIDVQEKVNIVFPDCFLKSKKCLAVALVEIQQNQKDLENELLEHVHK